MNQPPTDPCASQGFVTLGSCPPDEKDCHCGYALVQLIGGIESIVDAYCTDGCVEPEVRLFSKEEMKRLGLAEECMYKRCCIPVISGKV